MMTLYYSPHLWCIVCLLFAIGCDKNNALCLNDNTEAKGKWEACQLSCVQKNQKACAQLKTLEAHFVKTHAPTTSPDREGLRVTIETIIKLNAEGKTGPAIALAKQLELKDPQAFFSDYYDAKTAKRLTDEYNSKPIKLYALPNALALQGKTHGRKTILTDVHTQPKDPSSTLLQHLAIYKAKKPIKLYTLRLVQEKAQTGFALWSFIHDGSGFKYLGKMRHIETYPPTDKTQIATRDLPMKQVESLLAQNPTLLNKELQEAIKNAKANTANQAKDAIKKIVSPNKDKKTPEVQNEDKK